MFACCTASRVCDLQSYGAMSRSEEGCKYLRLVVCQATSVDVWGSGVLYFTARPSSRATALPQPQIFPSYFTWTITEILLVMQGILISHFELQC